MNSPISALVLFASLVIALGLSAYDKICRLMPTPCRPEHSVSVQSEITAIDSCRARRAGQAGRFLSHGGQQYLHYRAAGSRLGFQLTWLGGLVSAQRGQSPPILNQRLREVIHWCQQTIARPRTGYAADRLASDGLIRAFSTNEKEHQNPLVQAQGRDARASDLLAERSLIAITALSLAFSIVLGIIARLRRRQFRESRSLLASIVDSTQDAIIGMTEEGIVTAWNTGAERIFGYPAGEIVGKSIYLLASPDQKEETTRIFDRVRRGQSITQQESVAVTRDGKLVNVSLTVSPIRDPTGRVVGATSVVRDMAAQRQAEQALRSSAEQYHLLFQANPWPMWLFDRASMQFLAVNDAAIRSYGYSRDEFLNMTVLDIHPAEDVPALLKSMRHSKVVLGGNTQLWRHRKRDGTIIDVELTSHPLSFEAHNAELALAHDVTERRRSEERLRQSEEKFAKAFRSSPLAITISTMAEGRLVDVNPAFLELIGYAWEELISRTFDELNIWAEPGDRDALILGLREHGRVDGLTTRFRSRSGDLRLTRVSAERLELEGTACVLAIMQDTSEEKRLEKQLQQAQKMEAVGRLAGGIAHDFNNVLGVIIGYSELAQEELEATNPAHAYIEQIRKAGQRAASLTNQLLAFSRQQILQPRILNLNAVVDNLLPMLRRMIAENVELVFHASEGLGSVRADQGQIEQVLMNLAVNARDAMPAGGKLIFETSNAELDESYAKDHVAVRSGSYVQLSVTDTGSGMDAATVSRIFEPFFTTKELGKGTGLGLSIVYGVVKQSGGYIWVYSEPDKGTTFKIYLPRVDEVAERLEQPSAQVETTTGSEIILLVEDDDPLRKLTRSLLEANGYTVLEAQNGFTALAMARQSSHIDLLLSDAIMPGISGIELMDKIKLRHPQVKILLISGYAGELIHQLGVLPKGTNLLQKPFTRKSLLTSVRSVLDRSPE